LRIKKSLKLVGLQPFAALNSVFCAESLEPLSILYGSALKLVSLDAQSLA